MPLLEKYDEFDVAAEAASTESTLALVGELKPDVVVIDIGQPGLDSIEATSQIAAVAPGTKVIVLLLSLERRHVVEMLKSGTSGYLLKDRAYEELVDAIREVIAGNIYLKSTSFGKGNRRRICPQTAD